ncbi:Eukaryotic cytochrome b561 [Popillia japonica]|uniref:Eukaryotic cytochrome b561 n=1 Tax=Popillia japonica TaxID=7064 RepID=A0AAW1MCI3_POPJA
MQSDAIPLLRKRQNNKDSTGEKDNMEARAEHQTRKKFNLVYTISAALGVILAIVLITWLIHFRDGFGTEDPNRIFNWHPLLMIFGMVCCYSQSILIFRTGRNLPKKKLKLIHMFLNLTAFILSVLGIIAAFASHNLKNPPVANLYSLHSWIGLTTAIMFGLQFVIGFTGFLFPGYPGAIRAAILPIHTASGVGIFLFAIIAAITGMVEKIIFGLKDTYESLPAEALLANFMGMVLILFGVLVMYLVTAFEYKRVPIAEDTMILQSHTN